MFCTFNFLFIGIYNLFYVRTMKRGYLILKENNETFFEFYCRTYNYNKDDFKKYEKFINSKLYFKTIIIKSLLYIIFSILLSVGLILIGNSDYSELLDFPL